MRDARHMFYLRYTKIGKGASMRYGYFDTEHDEYVVTRPDVPVSWTNYLGVRDMCTVISHNAGGYSFYKSAEHHRITRFREIGRAHV
jgi:N,N'-diacetylchitobiose phosphorylase